MPRPTRPTSLIGLTLRAARLERRRVGCAFAILVAALALCCLLFHRPRGDVTVATFNIENFPRDARQIEGAFDAIDDLDAPVVAVQEITEPAVFAAQARARLGERWRFVHASGRARLRVGVLYDGSRYRLAWARTRNEPTLGGLHRPALEVRLRSLEGGRALRVVVVHLKAGGDHATTRREQLRQLEPVLAEAVESYDELVILGDFNATGDADRDTIAALTDRLGLTWASEPLACTSYWDRRDGCRGSALDHVLTRSAPSRIAARGPCEEHGCDPGDRCPAFHREVSDHCPVSLQLTGR